MKRFLAAPLALLLFALPALAEIRLGGSIHSDGTEVQVDLAFDSQQRIKNIGSYRDGLGMCVMSSIEMCARWANLEQLRGLRNWCAQQPGGAYPAKVDRQLKEFCSARKIPLPDYVQYEGGDLDVLRAVLKTGRMVAVTYAGSDGVRYSHSIAHMVCLVHLCDRYAVILDNNGIGETELLWMSPDEFRIRWIANGGGWAVFFAANPPPPPPRSLSAPPRLSRAPTVMPPASDPLPWPEVTPLENFGVETHQIGRYGFETFTSAGYQISREEALAVLGPQLTDDSRLLRLTAIGLPDDTAAILRDLDKAPELAELRGRLVVQAYPPEHWSLRCGFWTQGRAVVYVQLPDGRVLHRQDDYAGPENLALALRRADPNYQPAKDRDLRVSPLGGSPDLVTVGVSACGGGCLAVILWRLLPVLIALIPKSRSNEIETLLKELVERLPPPAKPPE